MVSPFRQSSGNASQARPFGEQRLRAASFLLMALLYGCAGASQSEKAQERDARVVPPEVADSSIEREDDDEPVVIPRVSVDVESDAGLDAASARVVLRRDGERCYRRALAKRKDFEARAVYELVVTSQGRVVGAEEVSMDAPNRRLEACLERAFEGLRFQMPPGNTAVVSRLYVRLVMWRDLHRPREVSQRSGAVKTVAAVTGQWL